MVACYCIYDAVGKPLLYRCDIICIPQRGIYLGIGIIFHQGLVGKGKIVWGSFCSDLKSSFFCLPDQPDRSGCAHVGDMNGSVRVISNRYISGYHYIFCNIRNSPKPQFCGYNPLIHQSVSR